MMRTSSLIFAALLLAGSAGAQASATASAADASNVLAIPSDQGIMAKLLSDVDAAKIKVGDAVQAETTENVKRGHETLLKKGAILTGHVVQLQAHPGADSKSYIGIVFDTVTPKGGQQASLRLGLEALKPPFDQEGHEMEKDGRGMAASQVEATAAGQLGESAGGNLTPSSVGVYGARGMDLGAEDVNGSHISLVQSTLGRVRLQKGTLLVFKPVEK
jgi:hypothetical protein